MKKFQSISLALCVGLALTGCQGVQENVGASATPSPVAAVTEVQFQAALKDYEKPSEDEFDGSMVFGPLLGSAKESDKMRAGSQSAETAIVFSSLDSKVFEGTLTVVYRGEDYLYFDSLDLKSTAGRMSLQIDRKGKYEDRIGSEVVEVSSISLGQIDLKLFETIFQGSDIGIRFNGSGQALGDEAVIPVTAFYKKKILSGITIFYGLDEGFSPVN
jgi:hypothetical protein